MPAITLLTNQNYIVNGVVTVPTVTPIVYAFDSGTESFTGNNTTITLLSAVTGAQLEGNSATDVFNNVNDTNNFDGTYRWQFQTVSNSLMRFNGLANYDTREVIVSARLRRRAGVGSLFIDYGDGTGTTISDSELPLNTFTVVTKTLIAGSGTFLDFPSDGNYFGWDIDVDYVQVNATGVILASATNNDPSIQRTAQVSFEGRNYNRIDIRLRRLSGTGWDGSLYFTRQGRNQFSESFKALMTQPTWDGNFQIITVNMETLFAGGTDWVDNTITGLRFDFGAVSNDNFHIDYIQLYRG